MNKLAVFSFMIFISIGFSTGFAQRAENRIDSIQLKNALEVIGLSFDEYEMAMMRNGVNRNISSYQSIRNFPVDNSDSPALIFNPLPTGYVPPSEKGLNSWPIPENVKLPIDPADLAYLSIPELASLIKTRKITSVALTKIFIERLKAYDDDLLCVISLTEDLAIQQAAMADAEIAKGIYRGILHGIPYGVKDLLALPGYPTSWGAMPYKDQVINETASVITKLNDAGAVLVAKLTLGALAMGDVWYGGTTKNPWNTQTGSSGSSAGPAAAVSAGLVPFAIGSETLGSIVSPSTRCAVTGLRPTFGRVSKYGAMALSWSMDKLGPICRSAHDCAIVLDYIRGTDLQDQSTIEAGYDYPFEKEINTFKVGYLADLFNSEYAFKEKDQQIINLLKEKGIDLHAVQLPQDIPINALRIILNAEAAAAFDDLTLSNRDSLLVAQSAWAWPNSFRTARLIPAVEYIQANRIRTLLIRQVHEVLKEYDVVLAPSFSGNQLTLTNLTGHPALLLPTGFTDKQSPTSITLLGNYFGEGLICAYGNFIQQQTKQHLQRPPNFQ